MKDDDTMLPPELEFSIFELTARAFPNMISTLRLVCSRVNVWRVVSALVVLSLVLHA